MGDTTEHELKMAVIENNYNHIVEDVGEIKTLAQKTHDLLEGKDGLVTQVELVKQSNKKSWGFICFILFAILGVIVRDFFNILLK